MELKRRSRTSKPNQTNRKEMVWNRQKIRRKNRKRG